MRLEWLEYIDFRDIVIDFLYNPIPKHIQIFLQQEEACEILARIIIDLTKTIDEDLLLTPYKSSIEQRMRFQSKEGSLIEIWTRESLAYCCCGKRSSIIIGDAGYTIEDTYEILLPMANMDVQKFYCVSSNSIIRYWKDKHKKGLEDIDYWMKVKNDKIQFKPVQLPTKGERENENKESD